MLTIIECLVAVSAAARQRNFQRWPEMGDAEHFAQEINRLKQWIINRINWINSNLDGLATIENEKKRLPEAIFWEQNYPNPFNSTTKFYYSLPRAGLIQIDLLNLNGQVIGCLLEAIQPAGTHSFELTADQLPSGIYFYRIRSEHFSTTKK